MKKSYSRDKEQYMHYSKHKDGLEEFTRRALPENWLDYAMELRDASNYIWENNSEVSAIYKDGDEYYPKPYYSRSSFLLFAFSIENLLKGILISENPKLISNGKISKKIANGHNLIELAEKITSINFTKEDETTLEILASLIPDWGKYPIPKSHSHIKDEQIYTESTKMKLNILFERLEELLWKLNKDGKQKVNGVTFPKMVRFDSKEEYLIFINKLENKDCNK